jgi:hypothetical protein
VKKVPYRVLKNNGLQLCYFAEMYLAEWAAYKIPGVNERILGGKSSLVLNLCGFPSFSYQSFLSWNLVWKQY